MAKPTPSWVAAPAVEQPAAPQPPPTYNERIHEAAAQLEFERYYRWCQAELKDYQDALADEDWIRGGC